jgi:Cu-processing system permease protein
MDKIWVVAIKEFKDGFRNRWIIAITLIFALCSLGLAYFGSAASGTLGFSSLSSTMVSLSSLAVILIPLISLMIAYHAFVGEYEQGTMLLLQTYPLSKLQMVIGKFVGQGIILAISSFLGFGIAAAAISISSELPVLDVLVAFSWFILSATLLGLVFISIAYVISLSVTEKSRAAGLALIVWFFFVLVFDLSLLALLVGSKGNISSDLMTVLLMLNPTDVFRLINYQIIPTEELTGVLQVMQNSSISFMGLFMVLMAWVVMPLSIAGFIFQRREG